MTKGAYVMRVGDIIVDETGRKIGVSRMDAELTAPFFDAAAPVRMPIDDLVDPDKTQEVKRIRVEIVAEFADFSVWRTDLKPEDLIHFIRAGDFFIVPNDSVLLGGQEAIRAVERFKTLVKEMGMGESPHYVDLVDSVGRYASWLVEKENKI